MIRTITEGDLISLIELEKATQIVPWSEEVFRKCIQSGYLAWVIEEENKIIGFIVVSLQVGECHILNVCIDPQFQRQGLGYQLLIYALKYAKAKGSGISYLEVRRSNLQAIELYKKAGFVEVATRVNYYPLIQGKEDAIVYAKDLGVDDEL